MPTDTKKGARLRNRSKSIIHIEFSDGTHAKLGSAIDEDLHPGIPKRTDRCPDPNVELTADQVAKIVPATREYLDAMVADGRLDWRAV